MSKLFKMSDEEISRILNLHESAKQKELSGKNTNNLLKEDMEPIAGMESVPLGKVEAVQQKLVDLGYNLGKTGPNEDGVDGVFGSKSRNAVIKYQQDKGISPALGNVGPKTAASLGVEQLTSSSTSTSTGSGSSSSTATGGTSGSSPFATKADGNAFRKWMHKTFPQEAKNYDLDIEGSHTNDTIKKVFNAYPKGWDYTTFGQYYVKKGGKLQGNETQSSQTQPKKDQLVVAPGLNQDVFKNINIAALDSTKSKEVCKADTTECGTYVNKLSDKIGSVGNAWLAHNNDTLGTRTKTAYWGLTPAQQDKIFNIFKAIEKQGGPVKGKKSGGPTDEIKALQSQLIPKISASDLKPGDVVGIYYPESGYHESAFHEAGKKYFVKDSKGQWQKGNTIKRGEGFGMNTHVGIVAFEKNGVPLVVHNISGTVYSDPWDKLKGNGKIMWIRRP
jgi:peptidoglycan hydrolase-like protein with peptidoglycan-binding domain